MNVKVAGYDKFRRIGIEEVDEGSEVRNKRRDGGCRRTIHREKCVRGRGNGKFNAKGFKGRERRDRKFGDFEVGTINERNTPTSARRSRVGDDTEIGRGKRIESGR